MNQNTFKKRKSIMNQNTFKKRKMRPIFSRSFNGFPKDLEVRYLSNALLVEESIIMLPNVLIKINMKRERNMQKEIENRL